MHTSIMTQKGQVTIPAEFRHVLNLKPGDEVAFMVKDNNLLIKKKKNDIAAAFGLYKVNKKISLEEIQAAIEEGPLK